jgi:hypothetical protein
MLAFALAFALHSDPELNICEVLSKPAVYGSQTLHLRADILLALPHGAILLDKQCPKAGLRLGYLLPEADSTAKDLVPSILNNCSPDPRPDRVPGLFTGKLAYSAKGRIEFRLLSISQLQNHPCPQPGQPLPKINWDTNTKPPDMRTNTKPPDMR